MTATVVIGLGNVAMSDDGLGVHAIRELRRRIGDHARDVELIEGGTAGLLLLPHLVDARRAIIVDAIDVGAAAGDLVRMPAHDPLRLTPTPISTHEIGACDLIAAALLLGTDQEQIIVYGLQPSSVDVGNTLSKPIALAMGSLVTQLEREVRSATGPVKMDWAGYQQAHGL